MIFSEMKDKSWRSFYLSSQFLEEFKSIKPVWSDYAQVVFKRTYARPKSEGSLEDWWETVRRVVEGTYNIQKAHCKRYGLQWKDRKAQASAQEMYRRIFNFKFLPPGRGLWTMGTNIVYEKGSACLNNCGFVSTVDLDVDFSAPFCFLMDMSMLGVGVGADTKGAGKVVIQEPTFDPEVVHEIADSREGWVEAIRVVLEGFAGNNTIPTFDYSKIREKGSPIYGFGGVASGSEPLQKLISEITEILSNKIGEKITSTVIVDLFNVIGVCVVAGGVRRTAEIMFSDPDDEEFLSLKDPTELDKWKHIAKELKEKGLDKIKNGDKEEFTPEYLAVQKKINTHPLVTHRWASNNSIFGTAEMDYGPIVENIANNGEPGVIWLDNMRKYSRMNGVVDWKDERAAGCNPCAEQTLESFELCCLVETFPSKHESYEDYEKSLKFAYLYAKTVSLVRTHDQRVNAVMLRNRRIGCSMSGIVQAFEKFGRRNFLDNWCDSGYEYIQKCDKYYSEWLCVPRSIKTTSVKPSGTVSLLAGTTPGIHYAHSEYYIRNVRIQDTSPLVEACRKAGYPIEPCVYSPNSLVVSFPVKEEIYNKGKKDASIWLQVTNAVELQEKWADNQVSITVTFTKEEVSEIKDILEIFGPRLKSISMLPINDHGYAQAPYITITKEQYEEMRESITEINLSESIHEQDDKFCDGDTCTI